MEYLIYLFFGGGIVFFLISLREGYLSNKGEDVRFQPFLDDEANEVNHGR